MGKISSFALVACAAICCVGSFAGAATLQERIDETPSGGTLTLEAGTYAGSATITKPMTLAAADPETTIIDGGGTNRCLKIESSNVTVSGIGFTNGMAPDTFAEEGHGGGLMSNESYTGVVVSNCVFRKCQTKNDYAVGGALYKIRGRVVDCVFIENHTRLEGGAAAYCDLIERCVFRSNSSTYGGAVMSSLFGGGVVRFSLFVDNYSRTYQQGAVRGGDYYSCTFVSNSGLWSDMHDARAYDCLFYGCGCKETTLDSSSVVSEDPFVDAEHGDYRVKSALWSSLSGDAGRGNGYATAGTLDLARNPILSTPYFVVGCYSPVGSYLQVLIDGTPEGGVCTLGAGTYAGPATIGKPMTLTAADPEQTIIDGGGTNCCLKIESSNVTVSGIGFTNGVATAGGAIGSAMANTSVVVSNCVFRQCQSTGGDGGGALCRIRGRVADCVFERNSAVGDGGAASECTMLERCVFRNNSAKRGGAVKNCTVQFSFFFANAASAAGGAGDGSGSKYFSSTFVSNTEHGFTGTPSSAVSSGDATASDCLFYDCQCEASRDCSYVVSDDPFVDRANGDYHLTRAARAKYPGSAERYAEYASQYGANMGWYLDHWKVADFEFFPAGCYAPIGKLQILIDKTPAGGVCEVPSGAYEPAIVPTGKDGISIVGMDPGNTVVDGEKSGRCLLVLAKNVSLTGLTFANGYANATDYQGHGGGVFESGWVRYPSLTVSNCTFSSCSANKIGGGLCSADKVSDCRFTGCRAESDRGGGVGYVRRVERCRFERCFAQLNGGGCDTVSEIWSSLFLNNSCEGEGGGAYELDGAGCINCTFVGNTCGTNKQTEAMGMTSVSNCLFYANASTTSEGDVAGANGNYLVSNSSVFFNAGKNDYHLKPGDKLAETLVAQGASGGKLDIEGIPLENTVGGTTYYYSGCYAYAPVKGLEVTDPGDSYPETNLRTSLREAIGYARDHAEAVGADGRFHITFSPKLFDERGVANLFIEQAQIDITGIAGGVSIDAPADRTVRLSGSGGYRPFRVLADGRLWVNNLAFTNCCGSTFGGASTDGGAILNYGLTVVSNAAFCACCGGGSSDYGQSGRPLGCGGAIANYGTALVFGSSFVGNEAAMGGVVWNGRGGVLTLVNSSFWANRALRGNGMGSGCGGAIAQDGEKADALVVNCTLTGNTAEASGGAVYTYGGTASSPAVHIVDSLVLGNGAKDGNDLTVIGRGDLFGTCYGSRNTPDDYWREQKSSGGKGPNDVFANVTADGAAVVPRFTETGAPRLVLPVAEDVTNDTYWVRHDALWTNAVVSVARDSVDQAVQVRGGLPGRLLRTLPVLDEDAFGKSYGSGYDLPPAGAMLEKAPRKDVPDPGENPLVIVTADEESVRKAFADAIANSATLTKSGEPVVISFAEGVEGSTIDVSALLAEIPAGAFAEVPLVLQGPITLDAQGLCRFFNIGEGNQVEFRSVTFLNGNGDADSVKAGGAIWGERAELVCTDCWFKDCRASFANAVCLDYSESSATFIACAFSGGEKDVWCDGDLEFSDGDADDGDIEHPVIGAVDFNAAGGTRVSVWPESLEPGYLYGLGRSDTPVGPYVVEEGGWLRADENGELPGALYAPKKGASGFYRIEVRSE